MTEPTDATVARLLRELRHKTELSADDATAASERFGTGTERLARDPAQRARIGPIIAETVHTGDDGT